ncbi:MAG: 50S ribosomal protein L17 [Verrucomicrobiota bacterium]|nr:50S ribosomal protein L17 [Verrucomicrobiota bacterium]
MRHQRKTVKLGRSQAHRDSLIANQTMSLIEHSRIKTTLAKAKAVRPFAEKLVTLAKAGTLHARRRAAALLHNNSERTEEAVKKLFGDIAGRSAERHGGYTRIIKLGQRKSDAAPMAFLEWVDGSATAEEAAPEPKTRKKTAKPKPGAEPEKKE